MLLWWKRALQTVEGFPEGAPREWGTCGTWRQRAVVSPASCVILEKPDCTESQSSHLCDGGDESRPAWALGGTE